MNPKVVLIILLIGCLSQAHSTHIKGYSADNKRCLYEASCPTENTQYITYLIDAKVKEAYQNCSFQFYIISGGCSFTTDYAQANPQGYVCFNSSGDICDEPLPKYMHGVAFMNCSNQFSNEGFSTLTDYQFNQEYILATSFIDAKVAVGIVCNSTTAPDSASWYPRACAPLGSPTSHSSWLDPTLSLIVVLAVAIGFL